MQEAVDILPNGVNSHTEKDEITFLSYVLKGFIFPCFSIEYYRTTIRKKTIWAVLFFLIFGLLISIILTSIAAGNINGAGDELIDAFQTGKFPEIVIQNGIAEVSAEQPFIYNEENMFIAIDTTGEIIEIDRSMYINGVLLTKSDIHLLNGNNYDVYPLSTINEMYGDPIIIDEVFVSRLWNSIAILFILILFIVFCFISVILGFGFIAVISLIFFGIEKLIKQGVTYKQILILGIFVTVPITYICSILSIIGVYNILLSFLLFFIIWGLVILQVFREKPEKSEAIE